MHIYGIQENGTEEFIYREAIGETHVKKRLMDMGRGKERVRCMERVETYITICKIDGQQEFAVWLRKLRWALYQPRGLGWGGRWEGG